MIRYSVYTTEDVNKSRDCTCGHCDVPLAWFKQFYHCLPIAFTADRDEALDKFREGTTLIKTELNGNKQVLLSKEQFETTTNTITQQ